MEDGALRMSPSSTMGDMAVVPRPEGERMPRTGDLWVGECPGVEATLAREGSSDPACNPITQYRTEDKGVGGQADGRWKTGERSTVQRGKGTRRWDVKGWRALRCLRALGSKGLYASSDTSTSITCTTA